MPPALASTCIRNMWSAILVAGTICCATQGRDPSPSPTDALPPGALARLGTLRMRHGGEVVVLAFSPDGKQILSGGGQGDHSVYLWELSNGERLIRLPTETGAVAVAFSPDGTKFAVACGMIVQVWDAKTGVELHRLDAGHNGRGLAFSADGKVLAIGGDKGTLLLWELGKSPRRLEGQNGLGQKVAFSPDGKVLATAATEWPNPSDIRNAVFVIRLWNIETGKVVHELRGHEEGIRALVFSPDGKILASGGCESSNTVRLWNVASGKELPALEKRDGDTRALHFSGDSRTLLAAGHEGRLRAWRVADGKALPAPVSLQDVPHASDAVVFSPAGDRLAMGCWVGAIGTANNSVNLWDLTTGKRLLTSPGHAASVKSLAFSADGQRLASCGGDGVILWDVAKRMPLRRIGVRTDWLTELALNADASLVAVRGRTERRDLVRLWETNSGKELAPLTWESSESSLGMASGLQFSANGKHLVATVPQQMFRKAGDVPRIEPARIQLWDLPAGRVSSRLPLTDDMFLPSFGPDGLTITVACRAGMIRWDVPSGKERLRLGELTRRGSGKYWTSPVALSPDARTLATQTEDGSFGLWESATGKERARLLQAGRKFENGITAIAFSPDSRWVVAGTRDGNVSCWDVLTGTQVAERSAHLGRIHAFAFTPDCRILASASADTAILLWDFPALVKAKVGPKKALDVKALEELWRQLEATDGVAAHRAIGTLIDSDAVAFLKDRLQELRVDQPGIVALIKRLDDRRFAERQKATEALKKLGTKAEADLRTTLDRSPPLELQRRIEELLAELPDPANTVATGERLRGLRSLMVLERTGTPAARQLLEVLAQDAGDRAVRLEAAAAVDRLRLSAARQP